jgi:hypothetical protein
MLHPTIIIPLFPKMDKYITTTMQFLNNTCSQKGYIHRLTYTVQVRVWLRWLVLIACKWSNKHCMPNKAYKSFFSFSGYNQLYNDASIYACIDSLSRLIIRSNHSPKDLPFKSKRSPACLIHHSRGSPAAVAS